MNLIFAKFVATLAILPWRNFSPAKFFTTLVMILSVEIFRQPSDLWRLNVAKFFANLASYDWKTLPENKPPKGKLIEWESYPGRLQHFRCRRCAPMYAGVVISYTDR